MVTVWCMYWGLILFPAKLCYTKKVPWVDDIKHATAYWWKSNAFLWKEAGLGGRGTVGGALGRGWFDKCATLYSGFSWEWDRSVGIAFRHVQPPHQVHFGNRDSFTRIRRFTRCLENYQFQVQIPETDNSQYIESWNYSVSLVQYPPLASTCGWVSGTPLLKIANIRFGEDCANWLKQLEALRGLMVLWPAAKSAWKGSRCMRWPPSLPPLSPPSPPTATYNG